MAKASKRALGGGLSGAIAGVCQVVLLMWLRTTMNYQYRNGGTRKEAMAALYKEGGIGRFYQGLPFAVVQAPLSRFGDTAANTGVLALLGALSSTAGLPIGVRTACASRGGVAVAHPPHAGRHVQDDAAGGGRRRTPSSSTR